jgi:hypothetical protein
MSKNNEYRRDARLNWFRNGKFIPEHRVPVKIRRMAQYMTPECVISSKR